MGRRSSFSLWAAGASYELYMGRWSRLVAEVFVPRLRVEPGKRWLDVGCGTGVLTRAILGLEHPRGVVGIDPSVGFLAEAAARTTDVRARFETGDAQSLAFGDATFDVVVSGLALNFVPDPASALTEMLRVTRPGGTVAVYVWDYADQMQPGTTSAAARGEARRRRR